VPASHDGASRRPFVRGLAVLADRRRRGPLVAIVIGGITQTVARLWLVLSVCGLAHGIAELTAVFRRDRCLRAAAGRSRSTRGSDAHDPGPRRRRRGLPPSGTGSPPFTGASRRRRDRP
jgi:hypothetical protein